MRNVRIPVARAAWVVLGVTLLLNAYLWLRYCQGGCVYDFQVAGKAQEKSPSAPKENNENEMDFFSNGNADLAALAAWCDKAYPVNDSIIITVDMLDGIPPFKLAVYRENDTISNLLLNGVAYRGSLIKAALLYYLNPQNEANQVVVDIGANIGLFSMAALSLGHTVVAFEPLSENYKLLQHSACLNGFSKRLVAYPNGIGPRTEKCWMVSSTKNKGNGHSACTVAERNDLVNTKNSKNETFVVQGQSDFVNLDDVLPSNIGVSIMNIDIEGYEPRGMFKNGPIRLFNNKKLRPPVVFGELYQSYLGSGCASGAANYINVMLEQGYVLTTPYGSTFLASLDEVCRNMPQHIVWVDKEHWDKYYSSK